MLLDLAFVTIAFVKQLELRCSLYAHTLYNCGLASPCLLLKLTDPPASPLLPPRSTSIIGQGGTPTYACTCFVGFQGGDCSQKICPFGPAWFDFPTAVDTAHASAECSNRGTCDRIAGTCTCQTGFEGGACETMSCPGKGSSKGICSGVGTCHSMSELAAYGSVNGESFIYTYGSDPFVLGTWDARGVMGCLCEAGFTGYDCR